MARRLAHDFGNVLTGVLGFCELALNHAADDSPARRFLQEAHHAEPGADLVRLLQLSGCRKAVQSASPSALPVVAAAEAARVHRSLEPGREFIWDVPADLARRLLAHDANVNVLFMSGHVSAELAQAHGVHWNFELLCKPFRSETLLRAVRAALERGSRKAPAGSGGFREVSVIPSSM